MMKMFSTRSVEATMILGLLAAIAYGVPGDDVLSSNWIGGSGLWSSAGNWDPAAVPGGAGPFDYHATINMAGAVVGLDESYSIDALAIGSTSTLNFNDGETLGVTQGVVNDGVISIAAVDAESALILGDPLSDVEIDGSGQIVLGGVLASIWGIGGPSVTHGADHAIRGAGILGQNGLGLINRGLVEANVAGVELLVNPSSSQGVINTGVMRATSGGVLRLQSGDFFNNEDGTDGLIEADAGSVVRLILGFDIHGGVVSTTGDGVVRLEPVGAEGTLRDITNLGEIIIEDATDVNMRGDFTNDGTIVQDGQTFATAVRLIGSLTVEGSGSWVLGDSAATQITAFNQGHTLTNGPNHTFRGAGDVGQGIITIVNDGEIIADGTATLDIRTNNNSNTSFTNNGTVRSTGPAGLRLRGGPHFNTNTGVIDGQSKIAINVFASLTNQPGGLIQVADVLQIDQGNPAGSLENQGDIVFSIESATMTTNGPFAQTQSGSVEMLMGGTEPGEFNTIAGNAAVTLDGAIEVELANGFVPESGDEVVLIQSPQLSGTFATATLPAGGSLAYTSTQVILAFGCAGDIDGSGDVAVNDLLEVLLLWGTCPSPCPADTNLDQVVDVTDLLTVLLAWGACN